MVCRHVQRLQSVDDVERLPPGPAVVLASLPSLEGGPARELLTRWATGERNLIVVPGRPLVRPCVCQQHFAIYLATSAHCVVASERTYKVATLMPPWCTP